MLQRTKGERIVRDDLPLAVYREVAAHLRQVSGVEVILEPQRSPEFNYFQSQVGGLVMHYGENFAEGDRRKIEQILQFYAQRYGDWQRQIVPPLSE